MKASVKAKRDKTFDHIITEAVIALDNKDRITVHLGQSTVGKR